MDIIFEIGLLIIFIGIIFFLRACKKIIQDTEKEVNDLFDNEFDKN
jgi:hypothetical protein